MDQNVHVAARAAVRPHVAFPGQTHSISVVDPCRNVDPALALDLAHAFPTARRAGMRDDLAGASALRTCAAHREKALLDMNLPSSSARSASDLPGAGLAAGALALVAPVDPGNPKFLRAAEDRFFEVQVQLVLQILATPPTSAPAPPRTEEVAEEVAEDVREVARVEASVAGQAGMPELVVGAALLGVAQDAVGLGRFLELVLGFLGARISVRVVLQGELAVSPLECRRIGLPADAQHLVIVPFLHLADLLGPIEWSLLLDGDLDH